MVRDAFLAPEAREAAVEAVGAVEALTSAELVVAVRAQSGSYRAADLVAGAVAGFAALLLLLFLPQPFAVATMPFDVLAAFGLGLLASSRAPALRRALTPAAARRASVLTAARAAFYELGVSKTARRNGVLVYVSLLERVAEVVTDVGIDAAALGPAWPAACAALARAVESDDVRAFAQALRGLAPPLAERMPRAADDVNELPDALGGE